MNHTDLLRIRNNKKGDDTFDHVCIILLGRKRTWL